MTPSTGPARQVPDEPAAGPGPRHDLGILLALAAQGDVEAFMAFYDRTCTVAYRAATAASADRESAERVACSLYVRAWRDAAHHPRSGLSPAAWLLAGITRPLLGRAGQGAGGPETTWACGA